MSYDAFVVVKTVPDKQQVFVQAETEQIAVYAAQSYFGKVAVTIFRIKPDRPMPSKVKAIVSFLQQHDCRGYVAQNGWDKRYELTFVPFQLRTEKITGLI